MNIHIYRQYDNRWRWLPYPNGGYYLNGSGCGACAVLHCIIEMDKYKNWTPADIQPYMKQFAIRGSGTSWAGIQKALTHYGLQNVANIPTMPQLWRELEKGNRVGVLLFGNTKGPDGTVWTTGGHYIAFTGYRVKNGKHQLYLKDSGGRKHDGWYSYEKSMRGDIRQVWVGTIPAGAEATTIAALAKTSNSKLTVDGKGGKATVKAMQRYFGTTVDGVITGQKKDNRKYYSALTSVKFGKGGSTCIKKLQRWVGASKDGVLGSNTIKKWQKKLAALGYYKGSIDGKFGASSMKAWQRFLNDNWGQKAVMPAALPATPTPTPTPATTPVVSNSNRDKLIVKARELSWARGTKASKFAWKGGSATPAFKTALSKAYPKKSGWSSAPKKGCSCDVAIGTLVRAAGVDKKYPRGRSEQRKYKSDKFVRIVKKNARPIDYLQPGDIGFYDKTSGGKKGHTFFYADGGIYEAANKSKYFHFNSSTAKLKKRYKKIIILRAK